MNKLKEKIQKLKSSKTQKPLINSPHQTKTNLPKSSLFLNTHKERKAKSIRKTNDKITNN